MAEITVTIEGIPALVARLGRPTALATLRPPMVRSTERLAREFATYPPPSHKAQPPRSRKQQIKLIMLAKEGKIPYRRTGNLGRAWTTDVSEETTGLVGTVGNSVVSPEGTRYGPLVEGESTQVEYHRGTWQTDQQVTERNMGAIEDDFASAIAAALEA